MDFNIGDLVVVNEVDMMGVVVRIDMDPEGENHDLTVLCGDQVFVDFHHAFTPV